MEREDLNNLPPAREELRLARHGYNFVTSGSLHFKRDRGRMTSRILWIHKRIGCVVLRKILVRKMLRLQQLAALTPHAHPFMLDLTTLSQAQLYELNQVFCSPFSSIFFPILWYHESESGGTECH